MRKLFKNKESFIIRLITIPLMLLTTAVVIAHSGDYAGNHFVNGGVLINEHIKTLGDLAPILK